MRRAAQTPKTTNLSDSVRRRLNMYALAASAAGVGTLALAQPAEAKIVYTPTHTKITPDHTIPLDLANNGTTDFSLRDVRLTSSPYGFDKTGVLSVIPASKANKAEGYVRFNRSYASALAAGVTIGPDANFASGPRVMATVFSDTGLRHRGTAFQCDGPWGKAVNSYLGLEFIIEGQVHFGWARLTVICRDTDVDAALTGYAYETVPGRAIIAGATQGPTDGEAADARTHAPEPATLGALALGAPGLGIWRREESAAVTTATG
jgi:hypothetical protein